MTPAVGLAPDMVGTAIINIAVLQNLAWLLFLILGAAFTLIAGYRWYQIRSLTADIRRLDKRGRPRRADSPAARSREGA